MQNPCIHKKYLINSSTKTLLLKKFTFILVLSLGFPPPRSNLFNRIKCTDILDMGFIDKVRKLRYIHTLIRSGRSGSANDIGRKIGACRRTVLYYIDILRDLGAEITYDHSRKSYIYRQNFQLDLEKL